MTLSFTYCIIDFLVSPFLRGRECSVWYGYYVCMLIVPCGVFWNIRYVYMLYVHRMLMSDIKKRDRV